ncbi:MAG: AbrB/MazE/SpoVT family DNA-binding domain-containing protein [Nitrososphaeria archaeon]|nr:AbrB/MazE/SpoVT family DNA-binding domain-containing protein [Nitrososphaeria archaeon]
MSIYDYLDKDVFNKLDTGEVRKIQITGKSTYIISLPKKWVKDLGLKAGSQLIISKKDNQTLLITPKDIVKSLKPKGGLITISGNDNLDTIIRKIVSLYLVGYSIIRVKTRSEELSPLQRNKIKEFLRKKLIGAEVLSEDSKEIEIRILIGHPELSLENALRRACNIIISMYNDISVAIVQLNKDLANEIIRVDDEVDRLYLYIIRQLKAAVEDEKILEVSGLTNPRDCLGYRVIVKFVERIADHLVKIAENILLLEPPINDLIIKKFLEISMFAKNLFEEAINSLYKKDYVQADKVIYKAKSISIIENEFIKLIEETKGKNAPILRLMVESVRRTAEYASDIAEIVLNLNIEKNIDKSL